MGLTTDQVLALWINYNSEQDFGAHQTISYGTFVPITDSMITA